MSETKYRIRFFEITSGRLVVETADLPEDQATSIVETYNKVNEDSGFSYASVVDSEEKQRVMLNKSALQQMFITVEEVK